jgi:hypothetical protein
VRLLFAMGSICSRRFYRNFRQVWSFEKGKQFLFLLASHQDIMGPNFASFAERTGTDDLLLDSDVLGDRRCT